MIPSSILELLPTMLKTKYFAGNFKVLVTDLKSMIWSFRSPTSYEVVTKTGLFLNKFFKLNLSEMINYVILIKIQRYAII